MTGDVVNLRSFRKQKQRQDKANEAAENRSKFGRTKAEKLRDQATKDRHSQHVDGHLLDQPDQDHDDRS